MSVAGGVARGGDSTFTRYSKRIHVRRGGSYRIFVGVADGLQTSNTGAIELIRTKK